jgi:hypothetical protein
MHSPQGPTAMSTETKSKHTAEPWQVKPGFSDGPEIFSSDDFFIAEANGAQSSLEDQANAKRIVSCVNACAGMEDPANAIAQARVALREASDAFKGSEMDRLTYLCLSALRALGG